MDSIWPLSVHSERNNPQDNGPKGGGYDELGRGPKKAEKQDSESSESSPSATA